MEDKIQNVHFIFQMIREYGVKAVMLIILLILLWFILIRPLIRLLWGMLKNACTSEKNIHKKVLFNFDGTPKEFQLEKTETKKIAYLERIHQGKEIALDGNSIYKVSYFVYPNISLIKKIVNWDKKYITLKIEPK